MMFFFVFEILYMLQDALHDLFSEKTESGKLLCSDKLIYLSEESIISATPFMICYKYKK